MQKEFIPYEQALALKELGFDEPCLKNWDSGLLMVCDYATHLKAPLYQQAFRWFRDEYDLFISIDHYENGYSINDLRRFDTYEEAEDACINKLIELVKKD